MRRIVLAILISLLILPNRAKSESACGHCVKITVGNQEDFDALNTRINDCLSEDIKTIEISLKQGVYKFHNYHIAIDNKIFPDLSLKIKGNGAIVMADGADIAPGDSARYVYGSGFISADYQDVENFSDVYQMNSLVEIVDLDKKYCRVPCVDPAIASVKDWTCSRIELTSWYTAYSYEIKEIKDGYIYFFADNLAKGLFHYGDYNVNYDYTVGHIYPRYRLVNLPVNGCSFSSNKGMIATNNRGMIHQCEAHRFMTLSNSSLKNLSISGIHFAGNNYLKTLVYFNNLKAESVQVTKCEFSALRCTAINVEATNNVYIEGCVFHDLYTNVISILNSSNNAIIKNNRFYNIGKGLKQTFCIICRGGAYKISKNEFYDFNYGAIGVGVWYGDSENTRPCYGIVEKNHIYYTDSYKKNRHKWTLIDSGAIYIWTKNAGTVIRNNFIHDYVGMGSNRGIYCDDGTNNCSVYNNIVLNIDNCYCIDLRRSASVEKVEIGLRSNDNNSMYGNIFNNRFRFEGREDSASSTKGKNTVLVVDLDSIPKIVINNVVEQEEDDLIEYKEKKWYRRGKRLVR